MLGFRNLEVEIKATSKTGARRMEVELLEGFPSLSAGDLQGSWRECGGSAEGRNPSLNFNFTSLLTSASHSQDADTQYGGFPRRWKLRQNESRLPK